MFFTLFALLDYGSSKHNCIKKVQDYMDQHNLKKLEGQKLILHNEEEGIYYQWWKNKEQGYLKKSQNFEWKIAYQEIKHHAKVARKIKNL